MKCSTLIQMLGGNVGKQYFPDEISALVSTKASFEPCYWSKLDFIELGEILCFLGRADVQLTPEKHSAYSQETQIIYESVFASRQLEGIFQRFILPRSIQSTDIDYGHSELERFRFADLSCSVPEALERMNLFSSIFEADANTSPETLRRQRKLVLDIFFTLKAKNPLFLEASEREFGVLSRVEEAMNRERGEEQDTQWGSLHHVLYGMCSGSDAYSSEHWSEVGSFSYCAYVRPALSSLCSALSREEEGEELGR